MKLEPTTITDAQLLLRSKDFGVLSTNSVHLNGCPFGSVANYCLDRDGAPLLYFSTIAQHTKNAKADPRCSLTVLQAAGGNVQSEARITLSGNLTELNNEEALARYHRYFPESITYAKFHDFSLYCLRVNAIRYIGGFGKIHWIEPADLLEASPFTTEDEAFIVEHMNSDHKPALRNYVRVLAPETYANDDEIVMVGVNARSIDLISGAKRITIPTSKAISDTQSAREVLVEMAKDCATR